MTSVMQASEGLKSGTAASVVAITTDVGGDKRLVNLNCIIQECLDKERVQLNRMNAIIRCDTLPHVWASENDLKRLCDLLIGFILQHPHRSSKMFIYIKCNLLESEVLPATVSSRLHSYKTCFYTNSCIDASWQALHELELAECNRICSRHSGLFVSASSNAGCLFELTLPGKLY